MAQNIVARAYHALNGKEARTLILAEIDKQLSLDSDFCTAHTFREIKWKWLLTVEANEAAPADTVIGGKIQQCDPKTSQPVPAWDGEPEPLILEVMSTRNIPVTVPPDRVREEAGLPVPTTKTTKRGETVDISHEMLVAEQEAVDAAQKKVNDITARPSDEAEVIAQVQNEIDPKKRAMMADAAHKRGVVIPVPVHGEVHDARSLARDVTENMHAELGLSEGGAVKLPNTPETRYASE